MAWFHNTKSIDLLHKSNNAPVPYPTYPTMHHFIPEMYACVHTFDRRQAIIWTNAGILLIRNLERNSVKY